MSVDGAEFRRLQWKCRRGMLENDLVLERFLARHGAALEGEALHAFHALLDRPDGELWDIVSGRLEPEAPTQCRVARMMRECV